MYNVPCFLGELQFGERKNYYRLEFFIIEAINLPWHGMAGHCMRSNLYQFIQICFDCQFVLEISHRLMHDIQWLDFINFSANLLQKRQTHGPNGLRYWMNGNKKPLSHLFHSKIIFEYEKPSTVIFGHCGQFFIDVDSVLCLYSLGDWRRCTFVYPLAIHLYRYIYLVSWRVRFVWYWELDNSHEPI